MEKYIIGLILIAVAVIIFGVPQEGIDVQEDGTVTCTPPYILHDGSCCLDQNANGLCDGAETQDTEPEGYILKAEDLMLDLERFNWTLHQTVSCTNCVKNPNLYNCNSFRQPLYYSCNIPEGQNKLSCTATVSGPLYSDTISKNCERDNVAVNNFPVHPMQQNTVSLCCKLSFWNTITGKQVESNEICKTGVIQPACEL